MKNVVALRIAWTVGSLVGAGCGPETAGPVSTVGPLVGLEQVEVQRAELKPDAGSRPRRHGRRRRRARAQPALAANGGAVAAATAGSSAGASALVAGGAAGATAAIAGSGGIAAALTPAGGVAGSGGQALPPAVLAVAGQGSAPDHYRPSPGNSWQIQLTGALDSSVDAALFDIDLFETSADEIAMLQTAGRKVICYFDTAYEPDRPDSAQLAAYQGNPIEGWPGQYWLDIRQPAVLEAMRARITLARNKGCDGVDADDVDSRQNNPGFPIGVSDQLSFITQLAAEAHAQQLAFGLKNALEDIPALLAQVDFAVNEECILYDDCALLSPFVGAGKPVFHIEYSDGPLETLATEICPQANAFGFDTLIKRLDLDAPRQPCR